jgi:hypothetical protein
MIRERPNRHAMALTLTKIPFTLVVQVHWGEKFSLQLYCKLTCLYLITTFRVESDPLSYVKSIEF